ncbi:hypothetical protein, partial [Allisonella histaminiformans]|uniref:hypothetical protein n=1 Tax=Allisonella histaminiformans TaxID=209880 RepID=UPI003F8C9049
PLFGGDNGGQVVMGDVCDIDSAGQLAQEPTIPVSFSKRFARASATAAAPHRSGRVRYQRHLHHRALWAEFEIAL